MDDPRLRESLRLLPEHRAGEEFTAEVLARVERFERRRTRSGATPAAGRLLSALAAGGAVAALALAVGLAVRRESPVTGPRPEALAAATPVSTPAEPAPPAGALAPEPAAVPGATAAAPEPALPAPAPAAAAPTVAVARDAGGGDEARFFDPPPAAAGRADALEIDRGEALARLAGLERERALLAGRLAELQRALPPADAPRVLLGGDEGLELVLDLGRQDATPPPVGGARPAVHRPDDDAPRRL